MAGRAVPEPLRWAVEVLALQPDHRLLEIGPGHGAAVELVCQRLRTGTITAIDRSATMVKAASARNAARAEELAGTLAPMLADHGYAATTQTGTTSGGGPGVCVRAEPRPQ